LRRIDVFNGDADGLCALRQLRLAEPAEAQLVTGVKRDIALLERVSADRGDQVTVLDVSLERNRGALLRLLERGAEVRYFDHHYAGEIPAHPGLRATIETTAGVCTSILVDRQLEGRYRAWAVAAAFGDGLDQVAIDLGASVGLGAGELEKLRELGRSLNYNAYGESEADLLIPPAQLYQDLAQHEDPLRFAATAICEQLHANRHSDLDAAFEMEPHWAGKDAAVYVLPDAAWSRRVSGTLANHLAGVHRRRAVAVLAPHRSSGGYIVSVRVPAAAPRAAHEFCRAFGGGGRREAAGIDRLPAEKLTDFEKDFAAAYG
jgi:single-stranded DNA-specific DHH superfamily exonuclease